MALAVRCHRGCAAAAGATFGLSRPHDPHPAAVLLPCSPAAAARELPGRRCSSSPAAACLSPLPPRASPVRPVASPVRPVASHVRPVASQQVRFYPRKRGALYGDPPGPSSLLRGAGSKEADDTAAFLRQTGTRAAPENASVRFDDVAPQWPTGGWAEVQLEPQRAALRRPGQGSAPIWADAEPEFLPDEDGGHLCLEGQETSREMEAQHDPSEVVEAGTENERLETPDDDLRIPEPVLHGRKRVGMVVLPQALQEGQEELLYRFSTPRLKSISRAIANEMEARAFVKRPPFQQPAEEVKYWTKHEHGNLEELLDESKLAEMSDEPKGVHALRPTRPPKLIPVDYNDEETVLTYVTSRMPSTYACIFNVLKEIKTRYPTWKPQSVLDYGTGPGTTFWAANELWDIKSFTGVDTSRMMLKAAHKLFKLLPEEIREAKRMELCRKIFEGMVKEQKVDLAVCAFAFERVTSSLQQQEILRELLEHTEMLVIIERSTAAGFKLVAKAREYLLRDNVGIIAEGKECIRDNTADPVPGMGGPPKQGFHVVAPCPHDGLCPLVGSPTICGFSQRLQMPSITRVARSVRRNTVDCGYSYVIIRKGLRPGRSPDPTKPDFVREALRWPRILFPPIKRKGHVIMDMCSPEGSIQRMTIRKEHGDVPFHSARRSSCGDLFPLVGQAKKVIRDTTKSLVKHKWSSADN